MDPAALFLLFALLGVIPTAIGVVMFRRTKAFVGRARKSAGQYVSSVGRTNPSGDGVSTYPVVEFKTAEGQQIRFEARAAVALPGRKVGKSLEVLYDPADPTHAVVYNWVELWAPSLIFAATGLMFILFGLVGAAVLLVAA